MSIEAVIAYLNHAGFGRDEDANAVARAGELGFAFTESEHRSALRVCALLSAVKKDSALCKELGAAAKPMAALLEIGRRSGHELDGPAVSAVLRALRAQPGELDSGQLDQVAGGARAFLPEVDDEVLVAFAHGKLRSPYVIGSLWNDQDEPPA